MADTDRTLVDLTETTTLKGVLARFKLGDRVLPWQEYETIFEGQIDDFGAGNFTFRVQVRDKLLTLPPKPITGFVTTDDFPNALPADVGKPIPICYGAHSVTEVEDPNDYRNRGAWPTLFVDVSTSERVFLIAGHAVKSIDEVYAFVESKGSQLLTVTTDYVPFKNGTLLGQTMAFVKLTSSGFTKLTDTNGRLGVLTVNVEGKEDNGDGSGALITNPIAVLRDLFANYLGSPELNDTKFQSAQDIATSRNYLVSGGYVEEKSTDQVLRDICNSFQIRIFPDKNGKIATSIFTPISPLTTGLEIREQWEILSGSWGLDYRADIQGAEDSQIVNSIDYKFNYHWSKKFFRGGDKSTDATSISTYGTKTLVLDLPWAANLVTASDVSDRIVSQYKNPVAVMRCRSSLAAMNIEITDIVSVTHNDGPGGGYSQRAFEIIEHVFNPNDLSVDIVAKDVGAIVGQSFFLDDDTLRVISDGDAQVTNGSGNIDLTGGTTTGVQIGDIIRLKDPTNEGNRGSFKITGIVDSDTITVANTVWTNESSITYDIIASWLTKTGHQELTGHLCDSTTEQFSNSDPGLVFE